MENEITRVTAPGPGRTTPRRLVLGVEFHAVTMADVVTRAERCIRTRERLVIGVLDATEVVRLRGDSPLREWLRQTELVLAESPSVVWASRLLGRPLPERVSGTDLFTALLAVAHRDRRRIFLLGARPEVLRTVRQQVARRWPGAVIVGSHHGQLGNEQAPFVADAIARSGADLLFVGTTTPRAEVFLRTYGDLFAVPVRQGVGASFEVLAGVTDRAPASWRRLGVDWAYPVRGAHRRPWRRLVAAHMFFLLLLMRERVHPSRPAGTGR